LQHPPQDIAGLIVIKAWLEGDDGSEGRRFRARIAFTQDLLADQQAQTHQAVDDVESATVAVREWLESFVAQ
jgi:hypothetical protein